MHGRCLLCHPVRESVEGRGFVPGVGAIFDVTDDSTTVSCLDADEGGEEFFHEDVIDQILSDANGEWGKYSGSVLSSTGRPNKTGEIVYFKDKLIYKEEWIHGLWHGHGQTTYADGNSYNGEYQFGERHGQGIFFLV